jgi:capsular polysaccharide biosynthesis protein
LRYWVLIIVGTLLGGALAFGVTRFMPQVFKATAIQLVKGLPGNGAAANYEAAQYAVSRAKTYPSFVYNLDVLEGVRSDLGNTESIIELRQDLSATNPVETPLLEISATAPTAEEAQKKANSAAKHMARFITEIETVGNKSPIAVETAVQATLPTNAASPKTLVIAVLGALIGFVLATVIALIHSYVHYQRRSAFRRKQTIGWVGEPAEQVLAAPVAVRAPPRPEPQAEPHREHQPEPQVFAMAADSADFDDLTRPRSEVSAAASNGRSGPTPAEHEESAEHEEHEVDEEHEEDEELDEFLMMEVDPHPTTEIKRTATGEMIIEEDDHTIEVFGPIHFIRAQDSAEQTDDDAEATESVDHDAIEPVDLDAIEPVDLEDSADAAAPDSAEESDDVDALERTWKQSAHR